MNEALLSTIYQQQHQHPRTNLTHWSFALAGANPINSANNDVNQTTKMMNLTQQSDRVTMKIDVSYTDHSHVIGKGGQSIKSIMTETQCHIHFPDSNRTNTIEKSNQVSISGLPNGVELARQKIRSILPLIYSFDIPFAPYNVLEQQDRSLVTQIQRLLEVSVSYRPMGKSVNGTTVYVKGIILRSKQTIKAVNLILGHHFGQNIEQVPVTMTIEVDPKHHSFLLNQGGQNSLGNEIFLRTGATVNFPDNTFTPAHAVLAATNPMGISGLFKKSTVTIWGSAQSTFEARQYLIGKLPVILMYDITIEEGVNLEMFNLNGINEKFDVSISIKLKLKQSTKSVIIRTTEQNVSALFDVKNILNRLRSYYRPIIHSGLKPLPVQLPFNRLNTEPLKFEPIPASLLHMNPDLVNHKSNGTQLDPQIMQMDTSTLCLLNQLNSQHNTRPIESPLSQPFPQSIIPNPIVSYHYSEQNNNNDVTNSNVSNKYPNGLIDNSQINYLNQANQIEEDQLLSNEIPQNNPNVDWRAPGAEYSAKQRELKRSINNSPTSSIIDEITNRYAELNTNNNLDCNDKENGNITKMIIKNEKYLLSNNDYKMYQIDENLDKNKSSNSSRTDKTDSDIISILKHLDLDKYIGNFIHNEIDINTFCGLTENDLKELGVQTLGARRKLMMAINEMSYGIK